MKSTKDLRTSKPAESTGRKTVKLEPIRKSGKDKHEMFKSLNGGNDFDDDDDTALPKNESILDYLGDEDDDDDFDDDDFDDDFDDDDDHQGR